MCAGDDGRDAPTGTAFARAATPDRMADRRELSADEAEGYGLDPTGRSGLTAWGPAETVVLDDGTTMVGVVVARP